jgi:hypothetical protein
MGQPDGRYVERCERFTRDLAFAASRLDRGSRVEFGARVELAARDLDVRGLSALDWRRVVGVVTERAWLALKQPALIDLPVQPFSAAGHRAVVARDRCECSHERLRHFDRGGSTVGCDRCECGAYARQPRV